MTDPSRLSALSLAKKLRDKELSPVEVVEDAISRIEKLNPQTNAVVATMYEQARDAAKGPLGDGPFAGVPYLMKDIMAAVKGVPLTSGSRMLQNFVPSHDSFLVSRLRKAGFVFLGKTNTPEFGFLPTTEPKLFGPCRNPWNTEHTTGGSSGGSAAAVAARMVPAAHANDGGGSIRIPASCCGLFGLKPTRGRITLGPDLGDIMGGLVCEHALTLSVRDSAAILDATAGPAPGDPYSAAPPQRPYLEETATPPGRLRVFVTKESATGVPVHNDCVAAVESAAALCAELGHIVEERANPLPGDMFAQWFTVLWTAGAALSIDGSALVSGQVPSDANLEPLSRALADAGRQHSASNYLLAVAMLQRISREIARFMQGCDVWLTPTLAEPPLPLGSFTAPKDDPLRPLLRAAQFAVFTPLQNATGEPAMNVPLYWNESGLPIGVQFAAASGREDLLLRLAAQLEEARPWVSRLPPVT